MTMITPLSGTAVPVVPKGTGETKLDQTAFLRLMTTQLKAQDPFNPMDNSAMVAQMAQFSSVAGISEMNASLNAISSKISAQTDILTDLVAQQRPRPEMGA
jgi:flagellar basal-body rod modification protein FlgD